MQDFFHPQYDEICTFATRLFCEFLHPPADRLTVTQTHPFREDLQNGLGACFLGA